MYFVDNLEWYFVVVGLLGESMHNFFHPAELPFLPNQRIHFQNKQPGLSLAVTIFGYTLQCSKVMLTSRALLSGDNHILKWRVK